MIVNVRCWFRIFYEAAKPRVELLTINVLVAVITTDPLTYIMTLYHL